MVLSLVGEIPTEVCSSKNPDATEIKKTWFSTEIQGESSPSSEQTVKSAVYSPCCSLCFHTHGVNTGFNTAKILAGLGSRHQAVRQML